MAEELELRGSRDLGRHRDPVHQREVGQGSSGLIDPILVVNLVVKPEAIGSSSPSICEFDFGAGART